MHLHGGRAGARTRLQRPFPLLSLLLLACLPPSQAGTQAEPDLVDAAGDVGGALGASPCGSAVDILAFWAEWDGEGLTFNYEFSDLSQVETFAVATDAAGRCIYSYTDFRAVFANRTMVDSVYIDYVGGPLSVPGWRFYLHESGIDLGSTLTGNRISVRFPAALLGNATLGDGVGEFRLQASTSVDPAATRSTDWAPDSTQACACWVPRPVAIVNETQEQEAPGDYEESPGIALPALLAALCVAAIARRRR